MKKINIIELFSGIGAQTRALHQLKLDVHHIAISDWFTKAIVGYYVLHKEKINTQTWTINENIVFSNDSKSPSKQVSKKYEHIFMDAIKTTKNLTDITTVTGNKIISMHSNEEKINLLTYSFPCQDLSIAGHKKGLFEGGASSMLWEVGRILIELKNLNKLPETLLMENVKNLLSARFEEGWNSWLKLLDELGYKTTISVLNSKDYGLPQNRERVFAVSSLKKEFNFETIKKRAEVVFDDILLDQEDDKYDDKINSLIYTEQTTSRSNIIKSKLKNYTNFNSENDVFYTHGIIPTITARGAYSRHKIFRNKKIRFVNVYEKALMMGFKIKDVQKLKEIGMSDSEITFLLGNSIPVNVLEAIFKEMIEQGVI